MRRALFVAALAAVSWLMFGARDASWARQEPSKALADQAAVSEHLRLLSPGSEITVFLKGGRSKVEGVLREVQDDAIIVGHKKGGGSTRVMLADIERLQTRERGRKVPLAEIRAPVRPLRDAAGRGTSDHQHLRRRVPTGSWLWTPAGASRSPKLHTVAAADRGQRTAAVSRHVMLDWCGRRAR
jgi:hypothetical protein